MKNNGRIFSLLGGFGLMIGALMPWASISSYTSGYTWNITGINGDGILTAILGILVIIIGFTTKIKPKKPFSILITMLGILSIMIIFPKFFLLSELNITNAEHISGSLGVGLYLSFFAGIFTTIGGLLSSNQETIDVEKISIDSQSTQLQRRRRDDGQEGD